MNWTVTAPIISHQKNYRFEPITNKHHETIIKYCMGKDDSGLVLFLQQMLQELCTDDSINIENVPVIDQVFLLVRLRSICIGTRVELIVDGDEEEKKSTYKTSLVDIQKNINKHYLDPITVTDDSTGVDITLHYSTSWTDTPLSTYITSIRTGTTDIDLSQLDESKIDRILEQLSTKAISRIKKAAKSLDDSIEQMVFVKLPDKDYDITLSHDQYTHLLRVLYSDTLSNFVELMYVFVKIINMQLSDVMKLTPSDTQMYYQMFVKETNEREKAQRDSNATSGRNVPGFS
jgi:hypothetical protein